MRGARRDIFATNLDYLRPGPAPVMVVGGVGPFYTLMNQVKRQILSAYRVGGLPLG
jgi:hypothetical protein